MLVLLRSLLDTCELYIGRWVILRSLAPTCRDSVQAGTTWWEGCSFLVLAFRIGNSRIWDTNPSSNSISWNSCTIVVSLLSVTSFSVLAVSSVEKSSFHKHSCFLWTLTYFGQIRTNDFVIFFFVNSVYNFVFRVKSCEVKHLPEVSVKRKF